MNTYYIYFYLRKDFTPYYVGKGTGKRAWTKGKNEIGKPLENSRIILVEQKLTELQAFILERYYIRWFGRKDIGTGILRNKTDGGEGIDSKTAKKIAISQVKNKTHPRMRREDGSSQATDKIKSGTHNFIVNGVSLNKIRVKNGTHHLLRRSDGSSIASEKVKNGTHNFLEYKNTVPCVNKKGICKRIPKEQYYNQTGPKDNWEWVFNCSKEGKKRTLRINT